MRIHSLKYDDHNRGLAIQDIKFNGVTLLVGASGVGKTQILNSIVSIQKISEGEAISGAEWEIKFTTSEGKSYTWTGEYELKKSTLADELNEYIRYASDDEKEESRPHIINEKLICNKKIVFKRSKGEIFFNDSKTPKLSKSISCIKLLKEEDQIKPVFNAFKKIRHIDNTSSGFNFVRDEDPTSTKYNSINEIRNSDLNITSKLYYAFKNNIPEFDQIKQSFREVFPQVEDISFKKVDEPKEFFFRDVPVLVMREKNIENDISLYRFSSGMKRTLFHIAEMHLASENSVFLIDEFENSLGINCIDEITDYLIGTTNNLQFIITSHHPYIINNIDSYHWKVVARKGGNIKTYESRQLNIGKSKHDSFIQLINSEVYMTGSID